MGTTLNLSYPGTTEMTLETGQPRQEVLLLQTEVRDASGRVVLPQGSFVTGQFKTDRTGSKFVASAIRVGDRTIPFVAETDYLKTSKPAVLQPGQIVPVQVLQEL